ncbi:hypothetical protein ACTU6U_04500 [Microbacterium sp. A196]|uniref:hypothetical protein n=1 Tax=unclassified Microbacterium TaxID=2609290 RepID=UPI003FD2384A
MHRRRERDGGLLNDRKLKQRVRDGVFRRVIAGSYVRDAEWRRLTWMQQHLVRVLEVADRARGPLVFTHSAAAAVHAIDRIGTWPKLVDVRIAQSTGGRSSGAVRRRALGFDGVDLVEWRGHLVTSPAQTSVDLAAEGSFTAGVIAFDQVLWARRKGGPLTGREVVLRAIDVNQRRGYARVPIAIDFSTSLADILNGRTPEQALLEEKDRADALRRQVSALSRWRTPDHRDPARLYSILTADGLPSRFPPPRRRS